MPAQGPFPEPPQPYGLIETFRWSPSGGYDLIEPHMQRLARSSHELGFRFRPDMVRQKLETIAGDFSAAARIRLVVWRDGSMEVSGTLLPEAGQTAYKVVLAEPRHHSADPWLRHKTSLRDRYEHPLSLAMSSAGADEILFRNERCELCEGARSNLFVRQNGMLLTPALSCGLLPGTLRAHLIETGQAREAVLTQADLVAAPEWFLGNSVRGLVRSRLIGPGD